MTIKPGTLYKILNTNTWGFFPPDYQVPKRIPQNSILLFLSHKKTKYGTQPYWFLNHKSQKIYLYHLSSKLSSGCVEKIEL